MPATDPEWRWPANAQLEWASKTDSDRQLDDVEGVVRVKGVTLDRAYVERWAKDLGVLDLWRRISPD